MKKTNVIILVLAMLINNIVFSTNIAANNSINQLSPFEVDRLLYGELFDDRIVIFDDEINYYNPLYFSSLERSTYQMVPMDPGEGGSGPLYLKYFSKAEWVIRSGVVSLSLTPKNMEFKQKSAVWESIYNNFSTSSYWKNSGNSTVDNSMKNQFYCHWDFDWTGKAGETWDLEPSKTDKGYFTFVLDKCN